MYKVYEKSEAIRSVQNYLRVVGNPDIFIAPSGVYDDNTRLSVRDFQAKNGFEITGEVNKITFDKLYSDFTGKAEINILSVYGVNPISLPIFLGEYNEGMMYINKAMAFLMDYYRRPHRLRRSNWYSSESVEAVKILRRIYMLPDKDNIDEEFYLRLMKDYNSVNYF